MNEELKVIISAEISKFKQGVENAKKQITNFKGQVKKASQDVDKHFKAIGDAGKKALKNLGVGIAAAGTALIGVSAATAEYRENQAKLATAFEAAGGSAATAKDTYNDLYRVLGDSGQATEAANHLAKLTTNEKDLADWTNICQGVYATFGDSLPIEGLTEAANETAKTGALTGGLADALNWAGVSEEAFNEKLAACNTEAEREQLIRETLNGLYSDAAAKYEENNAKVLAQNEANAKLQSTLAALGEAVAPIITAFTNFANNALAIVVPYIQQLAEKYTPLLQEALQGVSDVLGTVMGYLTENWETVLTIAGVIAGIAAAIGLYNTVAAIKAAMDAAQVTTLWGLVSAYAAQAAAMIAAIAPYILIVAAIAAVIAIIVLCVKHWDTIKETVIKVWNKMKEVVSTCAENIRAAVSDMVAKVVAFFVNMKDTISNKVSEMKEKAVSKFEEIKSGITDKINAAKTACTTAATLIVSGITNKFNLAYTKVTSIFENIKKGISDKIEAAKTAVSNAIDAIKGFMGFEWSMPKLKLPHLTVTGQLDLFRIPPSIPKVGISWYAKGGVFDSPTLFGYGNGMLGGLGENGAEAVVPLERNTKWLDIIADKLAAKQGNTPIVLTVDGKVFAQTSVDSINALTRQRGSLALNLI